MRLDTICAYTYQADLYCGPCATILTAENNNFDFDKLDPEISAEETLDKIALELGIDRMVEYKFDSGEFPKIAFREFLNENDQCARCGENFV